MNDTTNFSFETRPQNQVRTLVVEFQAFETQSGDKYSRSRSSGTPGKHYEYLYTGAKKASVNDWVLVHNGSEFGLCKIVRVKPGIEDKVTKNVIEVITQEDFLKYQEANRQIDEHRKVFDELDFLLSQERKMDRYKDLADRNPYAKELLAKLGAFGGGATIEHSSTTSYQTQPGTATTAAAASSAASAAERVTREDIERARTESVHDQGEPGHMTFGRD